MKRTRHWSNKNHQVTCSYQLRIVLSFTDPNSINVSKQICQGRPPCVWRIRFLLKFKLKSKMNHCWCELKLFPSVFAMSEARIWNILLRLIAFFCGIFTVAIVQMISVGSIDRTRRVSTATTHGGNLWSVIEPSF